MNGVSKVTVELQGKKVMAEFNPEKVSLDTIKDVIDDQGYEVK